MVSPLVRVTSPQFMHMLSHGHPLYNSRASMGSLWFVTKLYNKPVVEHSFMGEYLLYLLMKTYVTGSSIFQSSAQSVLSALDIRKATIVLRDAKVTKVFVHGFRHTYLACPSLGTIGADMGKVPLKASALGSLYRAMVVTRVFSLPCLMQA